MLYIMIIMRQKTIRLIENIHNKGIFGSCACGGEVLYYTDKGVRCSTCGKLYGVWTDKRNSLIQRTKDLIEKTQTFNHEGDESDKEIVWKTI